MMDYSKGESVVEVPINLNELAKHLNGVVNIVIKRVSGDGNPGSEDGEIAPRESQDSYQFNKNQGGELFQLGTQKDGTLQEKNNKGGRLGTATYVNPKKGNILSFNYF
jgi:hypothetical protein